MIMIHATVTTVPPRTPRRSNLIRNIALTLALIIAVPVALGIASAVVMGTIQGLTDARNADKIINEDDPRWNCATMGNRVCGR